MLVQTISPVFCRRRPYIVAGCCISSGHSFNAGTMVLIAVKTSLTAVKQSQQLWLWSNFWPRQNAKISLTAIKPWTMVKTVQDLCLRSTLWPRSKRSKIFDSGQTFDRGQNDQRFPIAVKTFDRGQNIFDGGQTFDHDQTSLTAVKTFLTVVKTMFLTDVKTMFLTDSDQILTWPDLTLTLLWLVLVWNVIMVCDVLVICDMWHGSCDISVSPDRPSAIWRHEGIWYVTSGDLCLSEWYVTSSWCAMS